MSCGWLRGWLRGEVLHHHQMGFWCERMREAPPLDLPTDRPRPAVQSFRGGSVHFDLPQELAESLLSRLARQRGATLFMILLAAFLADLRRRTGQPGGVPFGELLDGVRGVAWMPMRTRTSPSSCWWRSCGRRGTWRRTRSSR